MERAFRLPFWLFARCSDCNGERGTHAPGCPHAPRPVPSPQDRVEALTQAHTAVEAAEAALTAARGSLDPVARRLRRELARLERDIEVEKSLEGIDAEAY
jgi:hypothetical protein